MTKCPWMCPTVLGKLCEGDSNTTPCKTERALVCILSHGSEGQRQNLSAHNSRRKKKYRKMQISYLDSCSFAIINFYFHLLKRGSVKIISFSGLIVISLKNNVIFPGSYVSVDWVPAREPKGRQFYSQSGYMPGLQARSPLGGCVRGNHTLMFLSLSFSLPFPLSKNK